jgi:hypothetical protein
MDELLTESNFILYCAKHYDGRYCSSINDFNEDLKRIRYIKKLITRYCTKKDLKERLILNHIIILNNLFGPTVTCRILYFKLKKQFKYIKPFLVLLQILPARLYNINTEKVIDMDMIPMDQHIVEVLRRI